MTGEVLLPILDVRGHGVNYVLRAIPKGVAREHVTHQYHHAVHCCLRDMLHWDRHHDMIVTMTCLH
jgi:hypothetical protein